ncbi:hypothetical protein NUACC21_74880 [Scytonema sp. NUACC21]
MTPDKRKGMDEMAKKFISGEMDASPATPQPQKSTHKKQDTNKKAENKPKPKSKVVEELLEPSTKEATVRFTVDMPISLHRKLSELALRAGKKKVEIVRAILEEALEDFE